MPSTFAWLDYCESERQKALDVIQAFGDQGTLDELGIGTTRDDLADLILIFPRNETLFCPSFPRRRESRASLRIENDFSLDCPAKPDPGVFEESGPGNDREGHPPVSLKIKLTVSYE